jgi:CHAT domain-containing protein/tetratricopeptide (TPR) repeat protein
MRVLGSWRLICLTVLLLSCRGGLAQEPRPGAGKQPPLTPAQRERLKERDRLGAEFEKLLRAGEDAKAIRAWEKKLAIEREVLGKAHEDVVSSLEVLARLHEDREDFPRARKALRELLAIRTQLYGERDWRVTDARLGLKHLQILSALDARSRRQLELAADLNEEVLRLISQAQERKALPLARKALAIRRQLLGEAHRDYAASVHTLAFLYREMGEHTKALSRYEQAIDLTEQAVGEAHPNYATSLHNLAFLYQDMGEYGKALPLFERARDLTRKALGEAHPLYAHGLANLAGLYQDMGEYAKALPLYERARDLTAKAAPGAVRLDHVITLNNLAGLYQEMGEYAKALPLLEQARDLTRKVLGATHPGYATTLNNLALLYRELGEHGKALPLLVQARDLRRKAPGEGHPDYPTSLNNLAGLYLDMREHGKALPLYEQARDLTRKALGAAHPRYAISLDNLAGLYQAKGEHAKALPLLVQARDLRKKVLGEAHPSYAISLNNLAELYRSLGEHGKALPLFLQATDLDRKALGEAHPAYATSLTGLATLYQDMGKAADATRLFQQALALRRALFDRNFRAQSSRARFNFLGQHRFSLDAYLSCAGDAGAPAAPLYEAVLAWKGVLAARQAEERLARDRPELRPGLEQLRLARASLARLANLLPASAQEQASWRERFRRLEAEKEKLEVQLAQQSAPYLRWQQLRQVNPRKVSDALPPGTALLDFLEYDHWSPSTTKKGHRDGETRLLAFVLRRGREPALVALGPVAPIDKAMLAWWQALKTYQSPESAAGELSRRVWRPLEKHLGGVKTVLIAPDGVLTGLSFAALPGSKPKARSYLLEELTIGYVTSGRHLLELAAEDARPDAAGLLAVGGLSYGAAPRGKAATAVYKDLPGTRLEAEHIARLFRKQFAAAPAPRLLQGKQADVDRLKESLPPTKGAVRPRYLHLATHGFFEAPSVQAEKLRWERPERLPFALARDLYTYTRNPLLRCGLALAGANAEPEKGILRAEEVANLDLRGCQLAVLSACETALGKADTEGVQSLQHAFQGAGARTLVVSLWRVHDAATSVLMEELYTNLWQRKLSRLEALRQAQLTVLRDPGRVQQRQKELNAELAGRKLRGPEDEPEPLPRGGGAAARSHPALWAAFILSGDPGPVLAAKK